MIELTVDSTVFAITPIPLSEPQRVAVTHARRKQTDCLGSERTRSWLHASRTARARDPPAIDQAWHSSWSPQGESTWLFLRGWTIRIVRLISCGCRDREGLLQCEDFRPANGRGRSARARTPDR